MMKSITTILLIFVYSFCFSQNGSYTINTYNAANYPSYNSHIVTLSQQGFLSDASLIQGSSSFGTDQTAKIQAILNTASVNNPLYIFWDVSLSDTGLVVKSNTTIYAPSALFGAILRDSSNNFLFRNAGWAFGNNSIVDSNINIIGGTWNGNGIRGGIGKQLHSSATKGLTTAFCFIGVKNCNFTDFSLLNSRTYGMLFLTAENIYINNFILDDGIGSQINQDGIDFCGYARNITITNGRIRNGDDKIIFISNPTGGFAFGEHHEPYLGIRGDQIHIKVDNIYFDSLGKGFAFYCTGGNKMQDYNISNISGSCYTNWLCAFNQDFLSGYTFATGTIPIQGLHCSHINVEILGKYAYDNPNYPLACLGASMEDITFDDVKRLDQSYLVPTIGTLKFGSTAISFKDITINNLKCITSSPNAINQINISSATVNNLKVTNCNIDFTSSLVNAAFVNTTSGSTVTNALLNNNSVAYMKYVYANAGLTTNATITGIIHTGQGGSDPTVINTGTFTRLGMNGWTGVLASSGTIATTTNGNAF